MTELLGQAGEHNPVDEYALFGDTSGYRVRLASCTLAIRAAQHKERRALSITESGLERGRARQESARE
jgi:hypothetical protein